MTGWLLQRRAGVRWKGECFLLFYSHFPRKEGRQVDDSGVAPPGTQERPEHGRELLLRKHDGHAGVGQDVGELGRRVREGERDGNAAREGEGGRGEGEVLGKQGAGAGWEGDVRGVWRRRRGCRGRAA